MPEEITTNGSKNETQKQTNGTSTTAVTISSTSTNVNNLHSVNNGGAVSSTSAKGISNSNNSVNKTKAAGIEKIIHIGPSSEELLGSTFLPNKATENGHGLRASARVIHKLRMDSNRVPSPPPTVSDKEKKEEDTKKRDDHRSNPKTPSQSRASSRIAWSNAEKNMFFEALYEFGRDFDAIATYINNKQRRRNLPDACKTKDQVRVLFYQFYQKVSKYLKFSDGEILLI